jgi:predicted component of viral defense system (DUF524 family)
VYLHFAEEPLKLPEEGIDRNVLNHLVEREQIELQSDFIVFKNFTGILELNEKTYLVIPKKLAKSFGLIYENEKPKPNFENRYKQLFENFLTYILNELSRERLIYTLGLAKFPVDESRPTEGKIFKLLLLLEKWEEIVNSLQLVLSIPHKTLVERESYKPLNEVDYVDSEVVRDIVQHPERLYEAEEGFVEYFGKRYAPATVLQYETEESFDTPENRFVKHFLKELEYFLTTELREFTFLKPLKVLKEEIEYAIQSDIFASVGDLTFFPSSSQVLMKKAGYRELYQIYRLLHLSFVPKIFQNLDLAFSLKDMATLWEYYVLTELLKELKKEFGTYEILIDFEEKTRNGTIYEEAMFKFKNGLNLHYQKTLKSYSRLEFRPDFYIEFQGNRYIFDAKFRYFESNRKEILQNMHYYKDGLKTEFAVAVCFGNSRGGKFWDSMEEKEFEITSAVELLKKKTFNGIGFLNLKFPLEVLNEEFNA